VWAAALAVLWKQITFPLPSVFYHKRFATACVSDLQRFLTMYCSLPPMKKAA
jgi:hypothetical protein